MAELVIGVDPGWHTGIAMFNGTDLILSETVFSGAEGFVDWWWSGHVSPEATIVVEDYISDGTVNGRVWSSEVIGAIVALHPGRIVRQLRSDKTGLVNATEAHRNAWVDARFPGLPDQHQRDAVTHALVYLKNQRDPEVLRRYWL